MRSQPAEQAVSDLTNAEMINFAAQLREQRSFRINQLSELSGENEAASAAIAGAEIAGALEHGARHALAEIDLALDRLHRGGYGRCVDCGQAVGRDRLEVLPAAARCLPCQHRTSNGRPPPQMHAASGRNAGSIR